MTAPIGCLGEREAFEAWVLTQPGGTEYAIRRRDIPGSGRLGHYVEPSVDFAWQAICARSASRQEGWLPIETAPKDGTAVLLLGNGGKHADGYWLPQAYAGNGAWIWPFVHAEPRYWMPLPPAPAVKSQGDES